MGEVPLMRGRTQHQLADQLAEELNLPVRKARAFLQGLLDRVAQDLAATGRVELRGLGTFAVHLLPPRDFPHPATGKPVHIPARKSVKYRASKALKDRLNADAGPAQEGLPEDPGRHG